jgi:quercetin dioxygenase-like cupin family protein
MEETMALPQDIQPINSELADSITRSAQVPWIETRLGEAWTKVLWVGPESGRWAVLLKWKKGYVAPPHKHLSAAFAFVLSGRIKVRDAVYGPGDFLHEANGMVHGATEALEDTEYLFFCDGPVLFFDKDGFTGYRGWEEVLRLQQGAMAKAAE